MTTQTAKTGTATGGAPARLAKAILAVDARVVTVAVARGKANRRHDDGVVPQRQVAVHARDMPFDDASVDLAGLLRARRHRHRDMRPDLGDDVHGHLVALSDVHRELDIVALAHDDARRHDAAPRCVTTGLQRRAHGVGRRSVDVERRQDGDERVSRDADAGLLPVLVLGRDAVRLGEFDEVRRGCGVGHGGRPFVRGQVAVSLSLGADTPSAPSAAAVHSSSSAAGDAAGFTCSGVVRWSARAPVPVMR